MLDFFGRKVTNKFRIKDNVLVVKILNSNKLKLLDGFIYKYDYYL